MANKSLALTPALLLILQTPAWCQHEPDEAAATSECKDKTGIEWVLPFPKALAEAQRSERLLMIKPIAFGTEKSGGW